VKSLRGLLPSSVKPLDWVRACTLHDLSVVLWWSLRVVNQDSALQS
jgi:hypothetical protein